MSDPRETLIDALLLGTAADTIKWEQANANATSFIAKRESGTVTIEAPGGVGAPFSSLGMTPRLIVKDKAGKTVEEIAGTGTAITLIGLLRPHPAANLLQLYTLVHEQVTRAEATMRSLAKDFQKPG